MAATVRADCRYVRQLRTRPSTCPRSRSRPGGGRKLFQPPAAAAVFASGAYLASGLVVQSAGFAGKNLIMGTMAFIAAWPIWLFLAE
jgi:hypothetical protein